MKIEIQSYAAEWPVVFEYEKFLLKRAFKQDDIVIEHIGSTAVPHLSAKPVIDIMIGVPVSKTLNALVEPLLSLGYIYIRKYELFVPERRYFIRLEQEYHKKVIDVEDDLIDTEGLLHTHHIHVLHIDSPLWKDHLKFRDHLRNNPNDRIAYENLKTDVAQKSSKTINDYAKAKNAFVKEILSRFK